MGLNPLQFLLRIGAILRSWGGDLASRIEFVACKKSRVHIFWSLLSFDFCMCNTAYRYNPKSCLFFSGFSTIIHFRCPFAATAYTHSNLSLKSTYAYFSPPAHPPAYIHPCTGLNSLQFKGLARSPLYWTL